MTRDAHDNSSSAGGMVLLAAAACAVAIANSPWEAPYLAVLGTRIGSLSMLQWINDALMTLFFLLIGLECKRELLAGQLSSWRRRLLPGVAAFAGMVVPAAIFVGFNLHLTANLRGWAIPTATDIAFALGVFALLGSRVPLSLKVLLTAIAVLDDLLAVAIIAVFYTNDIQQIALFAAVAGLVALAAMNRFGVRSLWPYLALGVGVWYAVLVSGVHPTLAGVALAFALPLSHAVRLEHALQPWVAFLVVPLFGFANAGVSLRGLSIDNVLEPLPLGVAVGLFLGKQVGIFTTIWALVKLDWVQMPEAASWRQVYGMALLCGIGFTMSLFIGALAFGRQDAVMNTVKIGVFSGSLLAGVGGYLLLRFGRTKR